MRFHSNPSWEWVQEDVETRAAHLARFVPPDLTGSPNGPSLAREVLVRYGQREDVRDALHANLATESWSGPRHIHLQTRRDSFAQIRHNVSFR